MGEYHGDEHLCYGDCGQCELCEQQYWQHADEAYDHWRDEQDD